MNEANLIPACNWSNEWVEDRPRLVRELFGDRLVVREGDPEWEALGKRNDRMAEVAEATGEAIIEGRAPDRRC